MTNETNQTASFVCNREVRRVPLGWSHPRRDGKFIPLLDRRHWQELVDELGADHPGIGPAMPSIADLKGRALAIAAYETTTEGTPISPFFPDSIEGHFDLVNWCAEHATTFGSNKADGETWAAILFGEGAVVTEDGRVEAC